MTSTPLKSQGFHGFESHPCRRLPAETRLAGPGYEAPSRRVLTEVLTSRQSAVRAILRRADPGARRRGPRPSAECIIAEIGADMGVFPPLGHWPPGQETRRGRGWPFDPGDRLASAHR